MVLLQPRELLKALGDAHVEFVIVRGIAAVAHGASYVTRDLDAVAPLTVDARPMTIRWRQSAHTR